MSERSPTPNGATSTSTSASGIRLGLGEGLPLAARERDEFATRFGWDFGAVRLHHGPRAEEHTRALGARAFTLGRDVVVARDGWSGGRVRPALLAHELAHVVQQGVGRALGPTPSGLAPDARARGRVQLMSRGAGAPPANWAPYGLTVVPDTESERVEAAITMVREIVQAPESFSRCHAFFGEHCSVGTYTDAFDNAVIWKMTRPTGSELARGDAPGSNIAYTESGYGQGTRGLAGTFVHELMHNCGVSGRSDHYLAAAAKTYCMPSLNEFGLQFRFSDRTFGVALAYRRVLGEVLSGQITVGAGIDVDILGATLAALSVANDDFTMANEFGSAFLDVEGRLPLWGGERFGGLVGRAAFGLGAAHFAVREPLPGEAEGVVAPSLVLQITGGAEFLIPTNPHVFPLSIEAGYRMVQPLNADAEVIHQAVLGIGL